MHFTLRITLKKLSCLKMDRIVELNYMMKTKRVFKYRTLYLISSAKIYFENVLYVMSDHFKTLR